MGTWSGLNTTGNWTEVAKLGSVMPDLSAEYQDGKWSKTGAIE